MAKRIALLPGAAKSKLAPLDRALAAAQAGRHAEVLAALVELWATSPAPELAALIHRASATARTNPPGLRGKTAVAKAAWAALVRHHTAADLPALLDALADVTAPDAKARLGVLDDTIDPRLDTALVGIVEAAPYRATSTQPFWKDLFARLHRARDPSVVVRLAADTLFAGVAPTMRAWLQRRRDDVVESLRNAPAVAAPAGLAAIAAALDAATPPARDLASLEAAVYANPADDAPRLVFADALLERDDPRGELITLQCRGKLDRAQRQRERQLIDAHGKTWLGPLAPILRAGAAFERGFLAACEVAPLKTELIAELAGHPMWSTVRRFAGPTRIAFDPIMRSLRVLEFHSYEARNAGLPDAWRELLVDTPRPLEELRYHGPRETRDEIEDPDELAALARCAALPSLRSLTVVSSLAPIIGALATAPVLARLDRLGLAFPQTPVATIDHLLGLLAPLIAAAPVPTLELVIRPDYHTTELVLAREGKRYSRATLTIGPTSKTALTWQTALVREGIAIVRALRGVDIELVTRKNFTSAERVRDALPRRSS